MPESSLDVHALGLQVAQSRSYLYALEPKEIFVYVRGAPGIKSGCTQFCVRAQQPK